VSPALLQDERLSTSGISVMASPVYSVNRPFSTRHAKLSKTPSLSLNYCPKSKRGSQVRQFGSGGLSTAGGGCPQTSTSRKPFEPSHERATARPPSPVEAGGFLRQFSTICNAVATSDLIGSWASMPALSEVEATSK